MAEVDQIDLGKFSHDMSAWALFMDSDIIIKAVMLVLIGASLWCWSIIFQKRSSIAMLNRRAKRFEDSFWSGEPLDKIYERVKNSKEDPMLRTFSAGMDEWQAGVAGGMPAKLSLQASLKQRVERTMSVTIGREMNTLERGMTFLASVGSSAPSSGCSAPFGGL